jgi:hypothetical protein
MRFGAMGAPLHGTLYVPVTSGPPTPAGLRVLLRLEALRAGLTAEDLPDGRVRLACGELAEELELADACGVVGLMRGTECTRWVLEAGGIRLVTIPGGGEVT